MDRNPRCCICNTLDLLLQCDVCFICNLNECNGACNCNTFDVLFAMIFTTSSAHSSAYRPTITIIETNGCTIRFG
jgi:hypothetical protein